MAVAPAVGEDSGDGVVSGRGIGLGAGARGVAVGVDVGGAGVEVGDRKGVGVG